MTGPVHELLTPENSVMTLIDHQPQMLFGVAHGGAYGVGVAYAKTMLHPASDAKAAE